MVSLKNHQSKTRNIVTQNQNTGMIIYHGLGSGKTLTSIAIASKMGKKTVVVVPASLINNYKKEIEKFGENSKKFTIISFEKSAKTTLNLENKVLIVDEAHRLRNPQRADAKNILKNSKNAEKIILLTGTPFVNRPSDIAPLVNIVTKSRTFPLDKEEFKSQFVNEIVQKVNVPVKLFGKTIYEKTTFVKTLGLVNKTEFQNRIQGVISYYKNADVSNYPSKVVYYKPVGMSSFQEKLHRKIEEENLSKTELKMLRKNYTVDAGDSNSKGASKRVNAYLSGTRKVSNIVDGKPSQKVLKILETVVNSQKPVIVYSNFISQGVGMFQKLLDENNISNRLFTGSTTSKEKKQIVEDYNNRKFDVLCLSRSGSEGLDLKRTRQVHIMEPYWNNSQLDQVIGRAVRYKSHNNLPQNEKVVEVYHWYCVYNGIFSKGDMSSDSYLINMSKHKEKLIESFDKAVKEVSVIS